MYVYMIVYHLCIHVCIHDIISYMYMYAVYERNVSREVRGLGRGGFFSHVPSLSLVRALDLHMIVHACFKSSWLREGGVTSPL